MKPFFRSIGALAAPCALVGTAFATPRAPALDSTITYLDSPRAIPLADCRATKALAALASVRR